MSEELVIMRGSYRRVGDVIKMTRETEKMIFGHEWSYGKWTERESRYQKANILCRNATAEQWNEGRKLDDEWRESKRAAIQCAEQETDERFKPRWETLFPAKSA